jgi:uncharacterized protein YdbL (DUF1318 family)
MKNTRLSSIILFTLFLSACVTINVYFPAAAAEKAADQIIDEVWGSEEETPSSEQNTQPEKSNRDNSQSQLRSLQWLANVGHLFISPAYAGADIDINSPEIQRIQARMAKRFRKLEPHFDNGVTGLTNNALITGKDVPLRLKNEVNQLVAEENRDRLDLYKEIAIANGHPEWEKDIRDTFAERWIQRAKRGWWYQDSKGRWQQK